MRLFASPFISCHFLNKASIWRCFHGWMTFGRRWGRTKQIGCSSNTYSAQLTACLRDLVRHPTETVALCFGYTKALGLWANWYCVNLLDEQGNRRYVRRKVGTWIIQSLTDFVYGHLYELRHIDENICP
jgi:hypothetical protein